MWQRRNLSVWKIMWKWKKFFELSALTIVFCLFEISLSLANMLKVLILAAITVMVASVDNDLSKSQRHFAGNMLNSMRKLHPNDTIIFSPHSTYRNLLSVYPGTAGQTKSKLENILFLNPQELKFTEAYAAFKEHPRHLRWPLTGINFESAHRLYITKEANLKYVFSFKWEKLIYFQREWKLLNFKYHFSK